MSSKIKTFWMQGFEGEEQHFLLKDMLLLAKEKDLKVVLQIGGYNSLEEVTSKMTSLTGWDLETLDQYLDIIKYNKGDMSVWGEDNKILFDQDVSKGEKLKVLVPPRLKDKTFSQAIAFTQTEGHHAYFESFQGAVSDRKEDRDAAAFSRSLGHSVATSRTYLEGGNVLPGTRPDGTPYALVGRDSLILSTFHFQNQKEFNLSDVSKKREELEQKGALTSEYVSEIAQKLLSTAEESFPFFGSIQILDKSFSSSEANPKHPKMIELAKDFIAKLELTKGKISEDLGIPFDSLVFLEQPEFHIDMQMRPIGPGEILLQHPREAVNILSHVYHNYPLSRKDKKRLLKCRLMQPKPSIKWDMFMIKSKNSFWQQVFL